MTPSSFESHTPTTDPLGGFSRDLGDPLGDPISVHLNQIEMGFGKFVGELRFEKRTRDFEERGDEIYGTVHEHILGARGELALSKALNLYPSGLFLELEEDNDVGGIQVRTRRDHRMDLFLMKRDDLSKYYALVTGSGPQFTLQGFIHGAVGATESNWHFGNPHRFPKKSCWVVPSEDLSRDFSFLRGTVNFELGDEIPA